VLKERGEAVAMMHARSYDDLLREPLLEWLVRPSGNAGLHVAKPSSGWGFTTYKDLADEVLAFAGGLAVRGLPAGTVVTLMVSDPEQFIVSFFGCLLAGSTPSTVMPRGLFGKADGYLDHISGILAAASPGLVVVSAESAEFARMGLIQADVPAEITTVDATLRSGGQAERVIPPAGLSSGRTALLQFTSGSSGDPKGVRVAWRALTSNVLAIREWLSLTSADRFAGWLPLFHDMGLIGQMLTSITTRIDLWILTPEQFIRDPKRWVECFGRDGATVAASPSFGCPLTTSLDSISPGGGSPSWARSASIPPGWAISPRWSPHSDSTRAP
jgi:acyl-CoA synthetase (AMP-forming)/AMP-acid ligase II